MAIAMNSWNLEYAILVCDRLTPSPAVAIKSYTSLLILKTLMHYICDELAKQLNIRKLLCMNSSVLF